MSPSYILFNRGSRCAPAIVATHPGTEGDKYESNQVTLRTDPVIVFVLMLLLYSPLRTRMCTSSSSHFNTTLEYLLIFVRIVTIIEERLKDLCLCMLAVN